MRYHRKHPRENHQSNRAFYHVGHHGYPYGLPPIPLYVDEPATYATGLAPKSFILLLLRHVGAS